MALSNLYSVNTIDANGMQAKFRVPIDATIFSPSDTVPLAIKAALLAASNSAMVGGELSTEAVIAPYTPPATGYYTVQDRLVLSWTGTDGSNQNYKIPAPVDGIYQADSDCIVDLGSSTIDAYATVMTVNAFTEPGYSLADLASGLRVGSKLSKGR